jgi:hypothetical protein
MAGHSTMKIVAAMIFSITMTIAANALQSPMQATGQEDNEKPKMPQATCNYAGQKYYLTPHIFNDGEKSSRIDFPELPDDHMPKILPKFKPFLLITMLTSLKLISLKKWTITHSRQKKQV